MKGPNYTREQWDEGRSRCRWDTDSLAKKASSLSVNDKVLSVDLSLFLS